MTNTNAADGGARMRAHAGHRQAQARGDYRPLPMFAAFTKPRIVLKIDSGVMILTGDSLHIAKLLLEDGRLEVDGHIDGSSMNRRKRPPGGLLPGSGAKMKLFFETAGQAQAFLAAVPLGLVLAACLDASVLAGPLRPLADVLMMLTAGFALMGMMLLSRDEALRLYHLLAILTGALLYTQGIGRLVRLAGAWLKKRKKSA